MDWTGLAVFLFVVGIIISYAVAPVVKQRRRVASGPDYDETTTSDRPAYDSPALQRPPLLASQPAPTVPPGVGGGGGDVLAPGAWLSIAVDKAVHLMLVGETGSGKSTVAAALLYARARTEQILIIDPHAAPDTWGGLPAVGAGRDYGAIEAAFVALETELGRRFQLLKIGQPWGPPLSIFIDEYPTIAANCKLAAPAFKALAREGRKVDLRMVLLTQDANVKTLGIEGEGPVRENFSRVLLGSFAVKEVPALAGLEYPAALDYKGKAAAIETACCQRFAGLSIDAGRLWQPPVVTPPAPPPLAGAFDLDAELARFIAGSPALNDTPPPPATGPQWTAEHVKVAAWIATEPAISNREIARRLWPDKSSGGDNAVKAKSLRQAVEVLGVSPVRLLAEAANGAEGTAPERPNT